LHGVFSPQARKQLLAVGIEHGQIPLLHAPLLEQGELLQRIQQGRRRVGHGMLPQPVKWCSAFVLLGDQQLIQEGDALRGQ
jgi:hypothetical protein